MADPKRILIVEDEMMIALHIEDTLSDIGHTVTTATSKAHAAALIDKGDVDVAIVDFKLTDGDAGSLLERLKHAGIPFLICSGLTPSKLAGIAGHDAPLLSKPFSSDGLIDAVAALLSPERASRELH